MRPDYDQLTRSFKSHVIEPALFNHEAHVAVAFELLRKYDFLTAAYHCARGIEDIAHRVGARDKFNTTVTLAYLGLIAERMADTDCPDASSFLATNPDLLGAGVLGRWYSGDRLQSALARRIFLLPDTHSAPARGQFQERE